MIECKRISRKRNYVISKIIFFCVLVATSSTHSIAAGETNQSIQSLRLNVDKAEARFFELFNSYNKYSKYEVHCIYKTTLGIRRKVHDCKATFQRDYEAALAQSNSAGILGESYAPPSAFRMKKLHEKFRKQIAKTVSRYKKMRDAMNEFANAKKALQAARQKK